MSASPTPFRSLALSAILGAALCAAPAAQASLVEVRDGNGGNVFGAVGSANITIRVDGSNKNVAAGAFALQYRFTSPASAWIDFLTYCLEPDEWLGISGATPMSGTLVSSAASTTEYAAVANSLARLYQTWFADSLTSSTKTAAFQTAVWEIAYENGANPIDLDAGKFELETVNGVRTQALSYLNVNGWVPSADVGVILRVGNQDLIVQVPAPASLALFGIALAGLGVAARRRRAAG